MQNVRHCVCGLFCLFFYLILTHDAVFKSPSNIDVCHPVALSHMARAINKYITSTTSLGNHSTSLESVSSASGTWESLESYISRIILACQVPNIVAYTSLYLLMTISRSCSCKCTEVSDDFIESPKPKPPPLSHQISQAFSRSAISRVQRPHWVGHHFFMGPFLLVLRSYERISGRDIISHELLSFVSGLSANDLKDLESSIDRAMGTNTKLTIQEMLKQRDFRSLRETECPYITIRRMREARRNSLERRRAELLDSTRRENERSVPILCFFPWRINALAFSGISPRLHPMTAKMKRKMKWKTKQKMNQIDDPWHFAFCSIQARWSKHRVNHLHCQNRRVCQHHTRIYVYSTAMLFAHTTPTACQYANRKSSLRFPTSVVVARYSAFSYRDPSRYRVSFRVSMREWFYVLRQSWPSKSSLFVYSCEYSTASCPDKEWLSWKLRSPSSIYFLVDLSMFCCMESDLEDWRGERNVHRGASFDR